MENDNYCECLKPYPAPEHGECIHCGKELGEDALLRMEKLEKEVNMKKYPMRTYACDKITCKGELEVVFVDVEPTDAVQCPTCKEMTAKWIKDRTKE